ncbi:unnamed protein product, partial [Amoebophrya sp. A120]
QDKEPGSEEHANGRGAAVNVSDSACECDVHLHERTTDAIKSGVAPWEKEAEDQNRRACYEEEASRHHAADAGKLVDGRDPKEMAQPAAASHQTPTILSGAISGITAMLKRLRVGEETPASEERQRAQSMSSSQPAPPAGHTPIGTD